jgi:hypothetical protein
VVESYTVVPNASRARLIVPDRPPRVVWAALHRFNALRPPRIRLARRVLAYGLSTGAIRPFLRSRLRVAVDDARVGNEVDARLAARLAETVGTDVFVSLGIPPGAPYRKPVLELISPSGEVMGFAKVGRSDLTRRLILNEADVLTTLAASPPDGVRVPRLVDRFTWRGADITVVTAMPGGVRRYRPWHEPPISATQSIGRIGTRMRSTVGDSAFLGRLRSDVEELADQRWAGRLTSAIARLADEDGDVELSFGLQHGDWSPWNMALEGTTLWAFDWERAEGQAPLGLDVLNFLFYVPYVRDARGVGAAEVVLREGPACLRALGLGAEAARTLARLYLVRELVDHEVAVVCGAGADERLRRTLTNGLRSVYGRSIGD